MYQGNQEVDLNTLFTALNNWGPKIVWVFKTPPRETSATKFWHKDAVAELVGVLVAETIHPACMCEGGGRGGEGRGRDMGPENAVGEWARRRKHVLRHVHVEGHVSINGKRLSMYDDSGMITYSSLSLVWVKFEE